MIDLVRPNEGDRCVELDNQWLPVGICFVRVHVLSPYGPNDPYSIKIKCKLMNSVLHPGLLFFLVYRQRARILRLANHVLNQPVFLGDFLVLCICLLGGLD